MPACDDLFRDAPVGSAYETYAGTCTGRRSAVLDDAVCCGDAFG